MSWSARSAGSVRLWSPPSVMSLGRGLSDETAVRLPSMASACVICSRAMLLSKGVTGTSPQSMILAQFW